MTGAVGALALAALALTACSSGSDSAEPLAPVGSAATATIASVSSTTIGGPTGTGVVQLSVRLSGVAEELTLDRSTVAVADLDPITLDARCTALDGGDGYVVSIVDVRRLTAGQQLVSAAVRVTGDEDPVGAGEHAAVVELGTAAQDTVRFEGVMVLDDTLAAGTFEATANGAVATGSFACAADVAGLPTTTTLPPITSPESVLPGSTVIVVPPTIPLATS